MKGIKQEEGYSPAGSGLRIQEHAKSSPGNFPWLMGETDSTFGNSKHGSDINGTARVLVTGGTGFVASHILDSLLDHGFNVVVTCRSEAKGQMIIDSYPEVPSDKLSFVVVEDIARKGAFDNAVKTSPPLDFVIHTASPYHFNIKDAVKDFHEPAINGTTEILRAVTAFAPTVRRIVLTMSFASIVNPIKHEKIYDETCWSSITDEQARQPAGAYRGSKIMAEKAAWDYMNQKKPHFDLVTIHPPLIFGPAPRFLKNLKGLNTSNDRIRAMLQGETKKTGLPPTVVYIYADVRDVALAHVKSLQVKEAGGQRFLITGGHYSNKQISEIIRRMFPQIARNNLLPAKEIFDDTPQDVYGYDNRKSRRILGLRYRTLDECIQDTATSLVALGAGQAS